MLVDDAPTSGSALKADGLAHPEADGMVDAFLLSAHAQVAVAVRVIAADRDLEVERLNLDWRVPGGKPGAFALDGDAVVCKRWLEIVDDGVGREGRGDGRGVLVVVSLVKRTDKGEDCGLVG